MIQCNAAGLSDPIKGVCLIRIRWGGGVLLSWVGTPSIPPSRHGTAGLWVDEQVGGAYWSVRGFNGTIDQTSTSLGKKMNIFCLEGIYCPASIVSG